MKFLSLATLLAAPLAAAQAEEAAVPAFVREAAKSGGNGYCIWSPDYECYASGWPACCDINSGMDCPRQRPGCDRNHASYCVYAPDYSCYSNGWPRCCFENAGHGCPDERPTCDKAGAKYCVWSPDFSCYESGWPACCADDGGRDCPPGQPMCDKPGPSYCVWAPAYDCYATGWPVCCDEDGGRNCPDEQPGCDIAVDDCVEMGDTAAERVVLANWCAPGEVGTSPYMHPDYVAQCKEVATSVCRGQIYTVAQRWCPDETLSTSKLLDLQNKCADEVDDMLPSSKLALKE